MEKFMTMKKHLRILITAAFIAVIFFSCEKDDPHFEEELLIGKWVELKDDEEGTLYYRYDSDYTGATWDTSDDISEEEAQEFKWELVNADLTHLHIMETTGGTEVPKYYTVTELTSTTLKYKDDFGVRFSFVKVP